MNSVDVSPSGSRYPPLTVVSWSSGSDGGLGDVLRHDATALVGGTILVAGVLVALATVGASHVGDYRLVAFVALALFFGGPFLLVVVAAVAAGGSLRENFPTVERIRLRPFVLASLVGVAAVFLAVQYPPLLVAYLVVGVAGVFVVWTLRTAGSVDVEARTLRVSTPRGDETRFDLSDLRSVTTHRVGDVVVLRLRFAGGRGVFGSSFVSVPADRSADVRRAIEAVADRTPE